MYKSNPINQFCVIEHYPTNMYKVDSIYGNTQKTCDPSLDLLNLSKDTQSQLRRLGRLQDKLNQFCEDISLSHLIPGNTPTITNNNSIQSTSTKPELFPGRVTVKKTKNCVQDLVIQVNYKFVPYALLVAFSELATKSKCFISFFTHGSAVNELKKCKELQVRHEAIRTLFHTLKLDLVDDRTSYDFGVSIIWKKVTDESLGPHLILNSTTSIFGESNITRYLSHLCQTKSIEMDQDSMDKCTNSMLITQTQLPYLAELNKSIVADKFVSFGERAGMADFYIWSVVRQMMPKFDGKKFSMVVKWMLLVEGSCPMLQMLGEL